MKRSVRSLKTHGETRVNGNHGDGRSTEQDERWAASPQLIPKSRGDRSGLRSWRVP